ncbi:hypothetical protein [Rhodococcus koreensis]
MALISGPTTLSESVPIAARQQTAELVSQVTDTNRELIREAINQSIARGGDVIASIARIKKMINNPVRTEMIAQTESVNAYWTGLRNVATETWAKIRTWERWPVLAPCARRMTARPSRSTRYSVTARTDRALTSVVGVDLFTTTRQ